jgi:GT2 family glycosyltransferase
MSGLPAVTVVIPTHDRWGTLQRCLEALAAQSIGPQRIEVIVVDDGSPTDAPAEISDGGWPFSLTLLRQDNRGPAAARNRGLELATAPLTVFVNDDTLLAPGAIGRHVVVQSASRLPVMVLGRFDFVPDFAAEPLGRMLTLGCHLFQYAMLRSGDRADYHFAYTCNLSVPTAVARVSGFDEAFDRPAGEDMDFGLRLQQQGFAVLFDGGIGALHEHRLTVGSLATSLSTRGEGAVTFALKHFRDAGAATGMGATLRAADRDRDAIVATIAESTQALQAILDTVGPGEVPPQMAWAELERLSSAASLRGALAHPGWTLLAA